MEVFSVKPGVVGIKSFTYNRYLCMNRKGKLFTKVSGIFLSLVSIFQLTNELVAAFFLKHQNS